MTKQEIEHINEKFDRVFEGHEQMNVKHDMLYSEVESISNCLKGDRFGKDEGLVKEHEDLKGKHYKLVGKVNKIYIVGGVLGTIITGILTFYHEIQTFFK